jgi:hypothetical protein
MARHLMKPFSDVEPRQSTMQIATTTPMQMSTPKLPSTPNEDVLVPVLLAEFAEL